MKAGRPGHAVAAAPSQSTAPAGHPGSGRAGVHEVHESLTLLLAAAGRPARATDDPGAAQRGGGVVALALGGTTVDDVALLPPARLSRALARSAAPWHAALRGSMSEQHLPGPMHGTSCPMYDSGVCMFLPQRLCEYALILPVLCMWTCMHMMWCTHGAHA